LSLKKSILKKEKALLNKLKPGQDSNMVFDTINRLQIYLFML